MKRFLLALAAVVVLTVGSSFTSTAMAAGPGHHGGGHHHGGHHGGGHYGHSHGGHYHGGYSHYRPSYGYGGYGRSYGFADPCYQGYGRGGGVIQLYGPRGGFTFGF